MLDQGGEHVSHGANPSEISEAGAMAVLIAVYNSDGCAGRCDARCYDAQSDVCDCICGGMNHGAGLQKAQENTSERFDPDGALREFAARNELDPESLLLDAQTDLFPFGNEPTTAEVKRAARRRRREEKQKGSHADA